MAGEAEHPAVSQVSASAKPIRQIMIIMVAAISQAGGALFAPPIGAFGGSSLDGD
jgi:hypothetical protein